MSKEVQTQKSKKKNAVWIVLTVLLGLVALAVIAVFAVDIWLNMNFFVVEVSGNSMEHTLQNGDYLYAEKVFEIERGDIVILSVENHRTGTFFGESTEFIIKRVIAVEGDVVRITDEGDVYLKASGETEFTLLSESYVFAPTVHYGKSEWTVGEGEVFFMGDNRSDSYDSRRVDCFKASEVVGVVPEWAVNCKKFSTKWEHFRAIIRGREPVPTKGD